MSPAIEGVKRLLRILAVSMLAFSLNPTHKWNVEAETLGIPEIMDPTPGYWETSEYMIGNCSMPIIFLESNGNIDVETEDWALEEIDKVLSEIQVALDWWSSLNPDGNFSFYTEHYVVETGYEPITRSRGDKGLWIAEAMTHFGYPGTNWVLQVWECVNAFRDEHNTDWCFVIFVVDSSNDLDGQFIDGGEAFNDPGGPLIYVTYDLGNHGIENMDKVTAREIGGIFWAADEDTEKVICSGYLNVSCVPLSHCLMDDLTWCLSEGTWEQVGWRDSDEDGIQDIVDTHPRVFIDPPEVASGRINITGVTSVTPHPNNNPNTNDPRVCCAHPRNVTINKIQSVQYRIDNGTWHDATVSHTRAIVNFTFDTPQLRLGNHTIEVKAANQWGNSGYANTTVAIPEFLETDLNKDGTVNILDISIVALSFGTREGDTNYNVLADLDKNREINIIDVSRIAINYGKTA